MSLLTPEKLKSSDPVWSPDGTQIVFISAIESTYDIYIMTLDGTVVSCVTDDNIYETSLTWTPAP